jgi:serine protease Do/serine protease DegQ
MTGNLRAVAGALLLAGATLACAQAPAGAQVPHSQFSLAPMVSRVTPGVVGVSVARSPQANPLMQDPHYRRFFEKDAQRARETQVRPAGSGVIVDAKQGLVLTNHHVIQGSTKVVVVTKDRREFDAQVVGSDPGTDIAVLRIAAEGLIAVPIGDSGRLSVGDFVVAIGNPFGIGQTVTSGIVSALGRGGLSPEGYEDFVQTDAAINPGNSGGALLNLQGELIGINTAILGPGGQGAAGGNIGIGFAVPSNMARAIMAQIMRFGEVRRGRIGVQGQDVTPALARERRLGVTEGAFVESVDRESSAAKAGIRVGDVVTTIAGRSVRGIADLRNQIALIAVGDSFDMTVVRDSTPRSFRLTIAPITIAATAPEAARGAPAAAGGLEGASLADAKEGVAVAKVAPGSPAHALGLRDGDIILGVNRQPVNTVAGLNKMLQAAAQRVLSVQRGESKFQFVLRGGG